MQRHVPNALTGFRLVLAAMFFVLLSFYQYEGRGDPGLLGIAFVVYVIALVTDYLDGHLARKWNVSSAFGRVVDPFADKILVLGAFIFFAGKNFIIPESDRADSFVVTTITGVAPGMVVLMLGRELLVTSLRGLVESAGASFGAAWIGKFKLAFQSGTVLAILVYVTALPWLRDHDYTRTETVATVLRDIGIWGTVLITLYSGVEYVQRAVAMYRQSLQSGGSSVDAAPATVAPQDKAP
ncbi:MAG TPA: CDP-alcohol phosphatidyltransferase family protein [Tepidisphaeraceae bacterium]|nr:CDP-alcohol phosphatidyltransferase family protein [Tepidisphaeraceae bacterium]